MDNDSHYYHFNSRPPPANHDPAQDVPSSWSRPDQSFQWSPHASGLPQPYPHPIQQVSLPEQFLVHNGGLPPPYIGYHGAPGPDILSSGFPTRYFYHTPPHRASPLAPSHPGMAPINGPASDAGSQARSSVGDRASGLVHSLPSHNNPPAPPSHAQPASSSQPSQPGPSTSNFAPQVPTPQIYPPYPPTSPYHRSNYGWTRYSMDGPHNTTQRQAVSASGSSRRAARVRRTAPTMAGRPFESTPPDEYDELRQMAFDRMSRLAGNLDRQALEEVFEGQLQHIRHSRSKHVASKSTIQTLQSVNVEDLPENERHCCICYNDFGVASPEGLKECPLRLPKCQHVFGDHCIKKWLEESDTCPYCRDKLESEPKYKVSSSRAFLSLMRMRGLQAHHGGSADNSTSRPRIGRERSEYTPRAGSAERRSPSEDFEEPPRRTRQRREYSTREEADMPPLVAGPMATLAADSATRSANIEIGPPTEVPTSTARETTANRNPLSPSAPNFWPAGYSQSVIGMAEAVHLSVDMPRGQQQQQQQQQTLPNPLRFSGGAPLTGFLNNENTIPPRLPNGEHNPELEEVAP